jgi:thioredoxin-related protein
MAVRWIANVATVLIVAMAGFVFVHKGWMGSDSSERDLRSLPINYRNAGHTLIVFVQGGCSFCDESMPFYRRLLDMRRSRGNLQIAFAAPDLTITNYLTSQQVRPDTIIAAPRGSVPVQMTPTMVLVDQNGFVLRTWVGKLSTEQENDAIARLFG